MERIRRLLDGLKPAMLMTVVQIAFAGVNVFYKIVASEGASLRVIIAYRLIFATAFMVPVALIFERKIRPKMTWKIMFQAFLSGLFGGALCQNFYLGSLALTSATFASAMANLIPAFTFVLTVSLGLEKLGLKSVAGKAKVMGTLMGIGGAMFLIFYKGPLLHLWSTHVDFSHHSHGLHVASSHKSLALGSLLSIFGCISYSSWLIIQAKMIVNYPCPYSATALMCLMGAIQSTVYALCVERDWSQWKLGWDIKLLTVTYSGIVASGLMVTLIFWCVRMRGPLFVSVFNPLMLVLVAIASSLFLNEELHLGSILGGALIICGLYVVLWGKSKEVKKLTQLVPSAGTSEAEQIEIFINPLEPTLLSAIQSCPASPDTSTKDTAANEPPHDGDCETEVRHATLSIDTSIRDPANRV